MIDIESYRSRIGAYLPNSRPGREMRIEARCRTDRNMLSSIKSHYCPTIFTGYSVLYLIIVSYIVAGVLGMACDCIKYPDMQVNFMSPARNYLYNNMEFIKLFYIIILIVIIRLRYLLYKFKVDDKNNFDWMRIFVRKRYKITRSSRACYGIILLLLILNFLLIAIVNPCLLNPGPTDTGGRYSALYLNSRGLIPWGELNKQHPILHAAKIRSLNSHLAQSKTDIVIINETWLKPSILDNEVIPTDKYKVFRLDRCDFTHPIKDNGGGIMIGIRHDLDIESKLIPVKCRAEILGLELTDKRGRKTILATFYRVGELVRELGAENHSRVDQYLRNIRRRRKVDELILIGDLNMPDTNWVNVTSNKDTEKLFLDTFNDLSLNQLIFEPTHCKGNTLDLILTDKPEHILGIKVDNESGFGGSDHYPIYFNLKLNAKRKKSIKRSIPNFKKADWDQINSKFANIEWDNLLPNDNIDEAWSAFKSQFSQVTDQHIPKIKIKDEYREPWYDSEVHELENKKKWFHKRWKNTKSDLHYVKFAECRKQCKNLVEKKMNDNFEDEENRNHITKKFWSYVKSKSKSHRIPEVVSYKNRIRSNPRDQCELFNKYFFDQFSSPSAYDINIDYTNDHLYRINFEPDIIKTHLMNINPNKAQGPDLIHGRILKECASTLAYPLSRLFKLSYESGNIPADWKLANVVPVHKKGSKSEASNYRPISLTSLVMKINERVICDELLFRCSHLIDQRQHGFRASKSCCTQMVDFCDSLALSLNDNIRSDVIYFDFQKAFDSVNHDIILDKLKMQYRIDGSLLRYFVSYLKDRFQRVVINNEHSTILRVHSGVPQGSILGPTLFILFLNDITEGLSDGTDMAMYADDTKIWRRIYNYIRRMTITYYRGTLIIF